MTYKEALKLHNEDEVIVKETNVVMRVIEVINHENYAEILLEDGNYYHHKDIK